MGLAELLGLPSVDAADLQKRVAEGFALGERAVKALESLAHEQKRANDLYEQVNRIPLAQARNVP